MHLLILAKSNCKDQKNLEHSDHWPGQAGFFLNSKEY
jgi:hypothetical protein